MAISIAVSAGESSGDLNGSYLARELFRLCGDVAIWGAGGPKMREAGVEIVTDTTGGGTIGVFETLKSIPHDATKYVRMRSELLKRRPDVFVPIDYGAFNTRLAQVAYKCGINVVYYFPPSSWRRRPRNAAKLLACGGKVITPFPWSRDFLVSQGVDARFVGHPLIDIVKPSVTRECFLDEFGLSRDMPLIALLPGSRRHEVAEHLFPMIRCAEIMDCRLGGVQFVIAAAGNAERIRQRVRSIASGKGESPQIRVVERRAHDCIAASDLAIVSSGTATLEAAILGIPMVIIYRGSPIMRLEFLFRKSILEEYIGMPNIIAGRGVCPEIVNKDVTPEKIAGIALGLLGDKAALDTMRRDLAKVRESLGIEGSVERAARLVLDMGGLA